MSKYSQSNCNISILGKRKYQDAMGYENEDPEIQQQKLDMGERWSAERAQVCEDNIENINRNIHRIINYEKIPHFPKELFESSAGLQQIADWFARYNEYIRVKYTEAILSESIIRR
jgi:hypothetical protein